MQQLSMRNSAVKFANVLSLSLPLVASIVLAGGCKQGEGDFCQVSIDCADGLECNAGTQRCQKPGAGGTTADAAPVVVVDATVADATVPDAEVVDASPADASPDAAAAN